MAFTRCGLLRWKLVVLDAVEQRPRCTGRQGRSARNTLPATRAVGQCEHGHHPALRASGGNSWTQLDQDSSLTQVRVWVGSAGSPNGLPAHGHQCRCSFSTAIAPACGNSGASAGSPEFSRHSIVIMISPCCGAPGCLAVNGLVTCTFSCVRSARLSESGVCSKKAV